MPFTKLKTNNQDLDRVQDNFAATFAELAARPLGVNTVLVENITLTTSNIAVPHGLGRPPRGWLVVKQSAGVDVYSDTAHVSPSQFINLKSTASATVSLLFF